MASLPAVIIARRRYITLLLLPMLALLAAACSSGGSDDAATGGSSTTSTTAAAAAPLEILATNDDGVPGEGLAVLVAAVEKLDGVKVTVVAPASNQSGTGDATVGGDLKATEAKLTDGRAATAVEGKPADAVNYALGTMGLKPDLVVSGVNPGQNIGPFSKVSGTVGAAKTAARKGIPAVAASSGTTDRYDFQQLAGLVTDWITQNRAALAKGTAKVEVVSFNAPYCTTGKLRGLVEVPVAADFAGRNAFDADCTSTKPESDIKDDVDASLNGFASEAVVPL